MKQKLILMVTVLAVFAAACGSDASTETTWATDEAPRSVTTWATGIVEEEYTTEATVATEAAEVTTEELTEESYDGVTFNEER